MRRTGKPVVPAGLDPDLGEPLQAFGWEREYRVFWRIEGVAGEHVTSGFAGPIHVGEWKKRMKDTGVDVVVERVESRNVGPYSEVTESGF